jgi:hypothetical protein
MNFTVKSLLSNYVLRSFFEFNNRKRSFNKRLFISINTELFSLKLYLERLTFKASKTETLAIKANKNKLK